MSLKDLKDKALKEFARDPSLSTKVSKTLDGAVTKYGAVDEAEIARVEALVGEVPHSPGLGAYLAFLYYSVGRYDDAVTLYEVLIEHGYAVADQRFHLGNCRYQQGHLVQARAEWKACLDSDPSERTAERAKKRLIKIENEIQK